MHHLSQVLVTDVSSVSRPADPGVLGMPHLSFDQFAVGRNTDRSNQRHNSHQAVQCTEAIYDAMSKPTVERKQWQEVIGIV